MNERGAGAKKKPYDEKLQRFRMGVNGKIMDEEGGKEELEKTLKKYLIIRERKRNKNK